MAKTLEWVETFVGIFVRAGAISSFINGVEFTLIGNVSEAIHYGGLGAVFFFFYEWDKELAENEWSKGMRHWKELYEK